MTARHDVVGPVPAGRDPDAYDRLRRRVLWSMPTGLYVVGTRAGNRRNLMTISWVTQVATSPEAGRDRGRDRCGDPRAARRGRVFALSLLPRSQRALVRRFVKPVTESAVDDATGVGTMEGEPVQARRRARPSSTWPLAWLDCEVRHVLALGSHSWFVGEVVDCGESTVDASVADGAGLPTAGILTDARTLG